jgi:hypothetical protein
MNLVFESPPVFQRDIDLLGVENIWPQDLQTDLKQLQSQVFGWYFQIGKMLAPNRIGEIGVRFSYSARAMMLGSGADSYTGFDSEEYHPGCLDWIKENKTIPGKVTLIKCNTQHAAHLPFDEHLFDLLHVDGDHTFQGALHDMQIGWEAIFQDGYMLVDDLFIPDVGNAIRDFAQITKQFPVIIPSAKPLALFKKGGWE